MALTDQKHLKAVGYIRVSGKYSATYGESLSTQKEEIEKYAKYKDWDLIKTYADRYFQSIFPSPLFNQK